MSAIIFLFQPRRCIGRRIKTKPAIKTGQHLCVALINIFFKVNRAVRIDIHRPLEQQHRHRLGQGNTLLFETVDRGINLCAVPAVLILQ